MVPGVEGGVKRYISPMAPSEHLRCAMRYRSEKVPLIIIAGEEYGTGSARDWAAKGAAPAWRPRRRRRQLRAHPPQQSDRDGCVALPIRGPP